MKITFIQPNLHSRKASAALEPLVFGILAALTPEDIDLVFYDDRIEEIPIEEPTDMVAMSVETYTTSRAYRIAEQYLNRDIPVVMGGFHPTLCTEEVMARTTSVAVGDAESIWPDIIRDARLGRLKPKYTAKKISGDLPPPINRDIFLGKKYPPMHAVQWGRGCPHNCDFCSINAFYNNKQCVRPLTHLLAELETLGRKLVFFVDDNLFHDKKSFTSFLKEITPFKLKWVCQISIDIASDSSMMKLLQKNFNLNPEIKR